MKNYKVRLRYDENKTKINREPIIKRNTELAGANFRLHLLQQNRDFYSTYLQVYNETSKIYKISLEARGLGL